MTTQFSDAVGVLKETREKYIKMLLNQNLMQQVTVSCLQNSSLPDARKMQFRAEARKIYPVSSAQKIDGATLTQWSSQLNQRKQQSVGGKTAKKLAFSGGFGKPKKQRDEEEEEEEEEEGEEEDEAEEKFNRKKKKKETSQISSLNAILGIGGSGVLVAILRDIVIKKDEGFIKPLFLIIKGLFCAVDQKQIELDNKAYTQNLKQINELNASENKLKEQASQLFKEKKELEKKWEAKFAEQETAFTKFMQDVKEGNTKEAFNRELQKKDDAIKDLEKQIETLA